MTRDAEATRERLVLAARKAFSELGFERTTVRSVAAEAGVNPALINRYFGGKEQLFAAAVSIDLAFPDLSKVNPSELGRTLVLHFFTRWEGSEHDDLLRTLIRTAVSNVDAANRIRAILSEQVAVMVQRVTGAPRAQERALLIASQILGLAYVRYIVGFSDGDIARDALVAMVGDTLQRYLFAPLP